MGAFAREVMLLLAAKRWFEVVDGGDPDIFDRLPAKLKFDYCKRVAEVLPPLSIFWEDPRRVYMFGRPLAE